MGFSQLDRYRRAVDAEAEGTAQAGYRVADFFRTAAPLRHWLDRNVGADPG